MKYDIKSSSRRVEAGHDSAVLAVSASSTLLHLELSLSPQPFVSFPFAVAR